MQFTYVNTSTSGTTPATVLNTDGRAIVVRKIIVGKAAAAGSIVLFSENNALANNTTQIIFNYTYPTFAAGTPASDQFDFRTVTNPGGSTEEDGLFCQTGGSISISAQMQVTVLWDYAQG